MDNIIFEEELELAEEEELPSLTYALDLSQGRIAGRIDGLEAVEQSIRKILLTPRFRCLVYDDQYGSEVKEFVSLMEFSPELLETVIPNFIEDALKPDTRILQIYDFEINAYEDKVWVSFSVDTIFGNLRMEGVV